MTDPFAVESPNNKDRVHILAPRTIASQKTDLCGGEFANGKMAMMEWSICPTLRADLLTAFYSTTTTSST
jgi:hypothetical protein